MTGFAAASGSDGRLRWDWEARSVNGKGLDVRLRLADGFEALEPGLRGAVAAAFSRGSITIALKAKPEEAGPGGALDAEALAAALERIGAVETAAAERGLALVPTSAADVLALPGVIAGDAAGPAPKDAAGAQIAEVLAALKAMRAEEGAKLAAVLAGQLDHIAQKTAEARVTAEARSAAAGALLKERVAALLAAAPEGDPGRLAQELALLAVKGDVTEELDRLSAHVAAARALLEGGGPVGRKLDFLMQEFNREANTLCSKAGSSDLTQIGLDLKVVIDQMREQVANLE